VKIRLLFVYRFCTLGGVESILKLRLEKLPELGIEPYVLFLKNAGGAQVFSGLEDRVFIGADRYSFLRLLDELQIDVLSSVDTFEVLTWLDPKSPTPPLILLELHSTYDATLTELALQEGIRPDAVVVPSNFQLENIRGFLPEGFDRTTPVFVVPNAIDPKAFRSTRTWIPSGRIPQIVAWVGRIEPLKNWAAFLDIADELSARPSTEFWMVGGALSSPAFRHALRREVVERGLASRFRWWPAINHRDMPRIFKFIAESGGVVVLTTRNESFGLAALEAQAAGCPIVVPAVGALPEIVDDGASGFLYPPGETREATNRVRLLLDDATLRRKMGTLASMRAHHVFGPDPTLKAFAEVVRRTFESRCPPPSLPTPAE